jgi:multidrug efflux pump subunit AcrB
MLCILAVFIPAFFMTGAAHNLFVPLALAVGFSMVGSYLLSSTFVPVLAVWTLRYSNAHNEIQETLFDRLRARYDRFARAVMERRRIVVLSYLIISGAIILLVGSSLGTEIFPIVDTGQFQLHLRARAGTHIERTEQIALQTLDAIKREVGPDNVEISLGFIGTQRPIIPSIPSTSGVPAPRKPCCRCNSSAAPESASTICRNGCVRNCPKNCRGYASHSRQVTSSAG